MEQGGHPIMAHRKASSRWTQETKQSQDPTVPSSLLSSFSQWMLTKFRAFLFWVLVFGPVPTHVAFIMDGNRRYADSLGLARRTGHELGYGSLLHTLCDCFRLGIRVVTVYAFSVDNFRRPPEEVLTLMDLVCAKLNALAEEEPLLEEYGVRVRVLGDLSLLPEDVRQAASRVMSATKKNTGPALNICLAYSSVGEIVGAVQKVRDEILETLETHYRNCLDDGPFKEALGAVQKARDETLVTRLQTCLDDPVKEALSEQPKIQNETLETHHRSSLDGPVEEVLSGQQKKVQDETFKTLKTHHRSSLDGSVEETPSERQKVQDETFKTLETHPRTRLDDDPAKEPLSAIPKLQDETLETKSLHRTHLDSPAKEVFSEQQKVQEETFKPLETRHQTHLNGPVKEALGAIQDKTLKTLHWTRLHGPIEEALIGVLPKRIEERLYTFPDPPPDLLIRTSGETRLSDFLLWQTSFSHLVFCKVLWPDFSFRHLFWVILDYQKAYPHIMEQKRRLAKWMD